MQVGSTGTTTSTTSTTTTAQERDATIGYDAFLQLLIAQLKNQDPLKPIDSTEYVSQLTSLSNLEQAIKQNDKLEALTTRSQAAEALSMIGLTVTSSDGKTSGVVVSTKMKATGIELTLHDGSTMMLQDGMSVGL
jgi:flagellar basal-body rod modification protein FlgD